MGKEPGHTINDMTEGKERKENTCPRERNKINQLDHSNTKNLYLKPEASYWSLKGILQQKSHNTPISGVTAQGATFVPNSACGIPYKSAILPRAWLTHNWILDCKWERESSCRNSHDWDLQPFWKHPIAGDATYKGGVCYGYYFNSAISMLNPLQTKENRRYPDLKSIQSKSLIPQSLLRSAALLTSTGKFENK